MKKWIGPFFLMATGITLFLPSARDNHLLISVSLGLGWFITLYLSQKKSAPALPKEYLPLEFIPEHSEEDVSLVIPTKKEEWELKYLQTRHQFEEKQQALRATCKQLFQAENAVLALEKENTEKSLERGRAELELERSLCCIQSLTEEIEVLQETITEITKIKKGGRPRTKKLIPVEQDLLKDLL